APERLDPPDAAPREKDDALVGARSFHAPRDRAEPVRTAGVRRGYGAELDGRLPVRGAGPATGRGEGRHRPDGERDRKAQQPVQRPVTSQWRIGQHTSGTHTCQAPRLATARGAG